MSNKTQGVGSRGPYSTKVKHGASRPHPQCFITVHAITNFSSVKHKTVLCMTHTARLINGQWVSSGQPTLATELMHPHKSHTGTS